MRHLTSSQIQPAKAECSKTKDNEVKNEVLQQTRNRQHAIDRNNPRSKGRRMYSRCASCARELFGVRSRRVAGTAGCLAQRRATRLIFLISAVATGVGSFNFSFFAGPGVSRPLGPAFFAFFSRANDSL